MATSKTKGPIITIDERACLRGGEIGGQYLDALGKTDLATLTKDEWTAFLTKVVGGAFLASVGDVYGDQIPF
jgi:hypothetical protein